MITQVAWSRWRRARTLPSELRHPGLKIAVWPSGGRQEAPPGGAERPRGLPAAWRGPWGESLCSGGVRRAARDSIGATERCGQRLGLRGRLLSGGLLSLAPGGSGPWRALFGPCELRDRGGGCDPRLYSRFGRRRHLCTRDRRGGWRPVPPTLAPLGGAD
ncbi:hypothetical protein NDU88_002002 [Pleurodeles waltl]|uniref:Uncharacterized protein n=1 Tax=Pleurodeles waltl TaxID=8319 RepID=A0AAV7LEV6_PLEWA|nr:hypothetical protein NDU88_002002 [Pleurodeles waltl]